MEKSSGPRRFQEGAWDSGERPPRKEAPNTESEVFVGNLNWDAGEEDLRGLFGSCGRVVRVKVLTNPDGRSKGAAFVQFEAPESVAAALALNGTEHMGRSIKVNRSGEKPQRREGDREPRAAPSDSNVVFMGNVSYQSTEDDVRNFFQGCGEIKSIRLAKDEDGRSKGFAHVEFVEAGSMPQAIALNGTELNGRTVKVDYAGRKDTGGSRGGRGRGGFGGGFKPRGGGAARPPASGNSGGWD